MRASSRRSRRASFGQPLFPLLALALAQAFPQPAFAAPAVPEKVTLQLKWRHQFQFAGYYMAAEKGFYRRAGLEVAIRAAGPGIRFTDEVMEGRANYGINNTDLLIDRVRGRKVVALAVVFQHSPSVLLSLRSRGLESPKDFIGKRVMVSLDAEAEIFSMFSNESVPMSAIRFIPHSWDLDDLVSGKADAVSAYTTNESLQLKARGMAVNTTRPITYGIDFYGDCLFTSEAEIRSHRARTAAFLTASLEGWEYAMDHVDEACDLILAKYPSGKDRASLKAEAAAMDELIVHKFVPLGSMNPGRWRHIGDTYAKLGSIPQDYSLEGFLFDPKAPAIDPRFLRIIFAAFAAAMGTAIAYILILRAFNSRLAAEVATRTAVLEDRSRALSAELLEGKEKERIIAHSLAEKEVLLKEVHHRVKNNLQVIASIVSLQIEGADDPRMAGALRAVRSRVHSMALVHERLYGSGSLSGVDMDEYLRALAVETIMAYQRPGLAIEASVDASGVAFAVERAMPIGLIVGELVSNAAKHAFPGRARGRVDVRLRKDGGRFELRVSDDGAGMPEGRGGGAGIGLQLVEALASQLGGELLRAEGEGLQYLITFT
jgi:two-component sensor histidine kinase/ABC-type nitrate/sulfonate/bicarbonate transport system substrate-binding protein